MGVHDYRIFRGITATGQVWADRCELVGGDYKRLATINFSDLKHIIEPDCPPALIPGIVAEVKALQARRGQSFEVSTSGQRVVLGHQVVRNV